MEKSTSALIISIKMLSTYVPIFILLNLLLTSDYCLANSSCISYVTGSTQKVCQITGDFDKDVDFYSPTISKTGENYRVLGTDLGASFKHDGRIYFLFGDTVESRLGDTISSLLGGTISSLLEGTIPKSMSFPNSDDSIAYTTDTIDQIERAKGMNLTFNHTTEKNPFSRDCIDIFVPPKVVLPNRKLKLKHGLCSIPVEGFSYNGYMYVYFVEGTPLSAPIEGKCMCRMDVCHLTRSLGIGYYECEGNGNECNLSGNNCYDPFFPLYKISVDDTSDCDCKDDKFLKVQVEIVDNNSTDDYNTIWGKLELPVKEPLLFIWGTSQHCVGSPHLAYVPLKDVEDKSKIRYYKGLSGLGEPEWTTAGSDAINLFDSCCMGDPSVTWNEGLKRWLMLYTCNIDEDSTREILFRVAEYPWGPWSDPPQVLLDPDTNNTVGFCHFIHAYDGPNAGSGCDQNFDDLLLPLSRPCEEGKAYGPYVISDYTTWDATKKESTIYFTLSTWNPYQVMLMKAKLKIKDLCDGNVFQEKSIKKDFCKRSRCKPCNPVLFFLNLFCGLRH